MKIPKDYEERVYAGVLGKMIGVFLGRPIEGWLYEQIQAKFGEVTDYLHSQVNRPLIIPDDDLNGTFSFLRALEDNGYPRDLTSEQIGEAWLNYIVEGRTSLWWGGMGNSTEQTAFYRLKNGIPAPQSGSMGLNTPLIAEQIGAQIFIDGWAMVAPGDPDLAFHLATQAARVSHDGEAVYAAQVLAVMESLAFVEHDLNRLLDRAVGYIPKESTIYRLIANLRGLRRRVSDWPEARAWLEEHYGYGRYGGNVHVVPNHGVIILSLLYGQDDFLKTLMIANTAGWDTDCNAGNVGCLMGIKKGLAGIDLYPHLRQPLADRLFVSSAEGSRSVTDAVTLTDEIIRAGHRLAGLDWQPPKQGAQYHFGYPGSLQGLVAEGESCQLENVEGRSQSGKRTLALRFTLDGGSPVRVYARSFLPPEVPEPPDAPYARNLGSGWNYMLLASPRFYPGQTLRAGFWGEARGSAVRLFYRYYDGADQLCMAYSPPVELSGQSQEISWRLPDLGGPITDIGLEIGGPAQTGTLYLDFIRVEGEPSVSFAKPEGASGNMWRRAWVNAVDRLDKRFPEPFRLLHMRGLGQIAIGSRDWQDYSLTTQITPYLAKRTGLGVRYQGQNRQYAVLLVKPGKLQIVKLGGKAKVLAETDFDWKEAATYTLIVKALSNKITAQIEDTVLEAEDPSSPLLGGGVSLLIEEGWLSCDWVRVKPLSPQ